MPTGFTQRPGEFNEIMARTSASLPIILFFFLAFALADAAGRNFDDRISINCGSALASAALNGREWLGDVYPKFSSSAVAVEGSSARAIASREQPFVDPVPYKTARISRSQFSYAFQLNPGQKYIRLHFNPTSYKFNFGFKRLEDFFTVEAGSFTLLSNFSASITARALGLNTFTKEFCITILENQPFSLVFSPAIATNSWEGFYAFINGIEIISAPSSVSYCHNDDSGVQVVGHKYVVHIDSPTAMEMVHRSDVKRDSAPSGVGDDFRRMFTRGAALEKKRAKIFNDNTWKIPVDVGFRYLVRLHFCDIGLKMAESGRKDFIILINQVIAVTNADIIQEMENKGIVWYKNYMVMVNGNRRERKRDISISLHSKDEFVDGHDPLEGFEIFKLSNHDNNLASPNPLPPTPNSLSQTTRKLLAVLGPENTVATLVVALICLINIVVYKLRQTWKANFTEEENMPSTKVKRLCRHFSLTEIQLATDNFNDAFAIGKGGFGKVYKGRIDNGQQTVAIKRLKSSSKQGKREFQTEIEMLSELRHVNLVSLVGYCCEHREMILVYEYMPSGSLADHLYKLARKNNTSSSLSWKQRLKICIGAGQGLDYLHTGHMIIHRDIKASNILLDENFVAKVSDFGLATSQSGQSQASTNFKGTFGYFDPDYFRTRRLTMKSDTYSFGVVLLEVLCGRPAVEPWVEEDKRSLTLWACDKISKGEVDQIVDPNLREEISPASLKAFVKVAEKCLHDEPKKRPAIRHVIINLEFALEQQENVNSLDPNKMTNIADVLPINGTAQPKNANSLVPNEIAHAAVSTQQLKEKSSSQKEITYAADAVPYTDKVLQGKAKSLLPTETTLAADALFPSNDITIHPEGTRRLTMTSNVKMVTSPFKEKFDSKKISAGKKDRAKASMRKLSWLWPWRSSTKPSKKKDSVISISAPVACGNMKSRGSTLSGNEKGGNNELLISPNLKIFSLAELEAVTKNFHDANFLGDGGFGGVYKGWLNENGTEYAVAVKRLNSESMQGLKEWLSEVNFLGRLSHPNMIKLIGFCFEHNEQLLVYEFMQKGNLACQLFQRDIEPLSWDIRVKILIGAAQGLAFLHALDRKVIYRDFKSSNILLDMSYHAKLSDFGLALWGPVAEHSHVTTGIIGTYGYAAPEYIATGHLYVKSDVYGFGVVLLETLTGLQALDKNRPTGQQNLIDWIKPLLSNRRKFCNIIDPRLKGRYPVKSAFQIAQLAQNCLAKHPENRPSSQEIVEMLEKNQS